eukprot:COSAG06_NODE_8645_length_2107_cov_2.192231_3_plen_109_part_01
METVESRAEHGTLGTEAFIQQVESSEAWQAALSDVDHTNGAVHQVIREIFVRFCQICGVVLDVGTEAIFAAAIVNDDGRSSWVVCSPGLRDRGEKGRWTGGSRRLQAWS